MATIVNERDKILQTAAKRIIVIDPPDPIIIDGYTGITLVRNPPVSVFNSVTQIEITAILKGIPLNSVVTWTSTSPLTDTLDPLVKVIRWATLAAADIRAGRTSITASVGYAGQTFTATTTVFIQNG